MASKDYGECNNDQVCIYEQDSEVYLRIGGVLENLVDVEVQDKVEIFDINRNIYVSADGDVLIVKFSELLGAPEWRFSSALIVIQPNIKPCRRNNSCKQVIRQPAYVDIGIGSGDTRQLQVCTLIAASEDKVYLIKGPFEDSECGDIEVAPGVLRANEALTPS